MQSYNAVSPKDKAMMLARKKKRDQSTLRKLAKEREEILEDIERLRKEEREEEIAKLPIKATDGKHLDEILGRDTVNMLLDLQEFGNDFVALKYHSNRAHMNIARGLLSENPQEQAYWTKLAVDMMNNAENRKVKREDAMKELGQKKMGAELIRKFKEMEVVNDEGESNQDRGAEELHNSFSDSA